MLNILSGETLKIALKSKKIQIPVVWAVGTRLTQNHMISHMAGLSRDLLYTGLLGPIQWKYKNKEACWQDSYNFPLPVLSISRLESESYSRHLDRYLCLTVGFFTLLCHAGGGGGPTSSKFKIQPSKICKVPLKKNNTTFYKDLWCKQISLCIL
jgi:hypothetical protein